MEPLENRHSGRRKSPIHSTIYSVAYCPCGVTLKTTTLLYEDYISRTGYGIKQKCDIELFVARIETVTISSDMKNGTVYAHYREQDFNKKDWCCVIYTLKNSIWSAIICFP